MTIARDANEFAAAIEAALRSGRRTVDAQTLAPLAWEARIAQTIELIDRTVGTATST